MADDVEATTSTTTTTTALAPSADSDGDIVVWRRGEQRPPNWPSGSFRRPYPDIIDPGFAPDYYKRFRVPQVPNSQAGKPLPDFKLVPVNLTEILSEDTTPENDTSETSEAGSSKNGTLEVQDVPGVVIEPIRVRRQATATPAPGPSRTSDASPLNGLFDLTNLSSRIFERLPSGIIDPGFAPNAFDRFLQGLRNNQQQQQQGQQVPATQAPRLYPDLEGEKLNPGAPAAGGQHGQAGTQRPLLGIIDQNAFDKFMQGLRSIQPQQQGQQATRAEVEGTNLDARTLANAGQNRQGSSQRLPEAAREMLQGLGQLGSDVLDRLNVYRNENAFAEFLQNMHQPSASRDIFTNLFRREPSTS
uniref:Uncharacterized protein n=1 Tax=Ixodes ricinus TaxID=34613 RepID=V5HBW8_IXORI